MGTPTTRTRAHGTRQKYVHEQCRCTPCTEANATYQRTRARAIHRPDSTWAPIVTATEAAALLELLRARGHGLRHISKTTGIARSTLAAIADGTRTSIRPDTLAALRAADTARAAGHLVDATRTANALDALRTAGWTPSELRRITGQNRSYRLRASLVQQHTEDHVTAVARALGAIIDADGTVVVSPAPPHALRR
jgi:DNA-binding Xre family transcriptional regulator